MSAQDVPPTEETVPNNGAVPETAAPTLEEQPQTLEEKVMEMDIKTSSLSELAAWCRTLGLSEGGTREELANRLRTYYELAPPHQEDGGEQKKEKVITIESARSTEYFTLDVVDEEYARLRGDVVISLKDGEAIHLIKAGEILYNRTRNLMTASGKVEYEKREGDTIETFKGESITVNLDNWSSIFLGGMTERSLNEDDTAAYRFGGTVISRSNEEVTVMTDAVISNAKNEESYWSLHAKKLWLLPGSDWAILSAVLKVGEVPLLYIPFFYYPADEVIFHPVIGHRSRVGNFIQTTTYIFGRPKASTSTESSISKILGSGEDMEKIREGIFLRSTGKKSRDPNDTRFSFLLDAYANLGVYLGTELTLPRKNILGSIDLSAGLGFSRDIYRLGSGYSPFAQYEGTDNWNKSWLFSTEVPFRYRFNTTGSLSGTYGSLSWNFPFYADPYVNQDFLERSEEMDWVKMLKGETEEEDASKNVIGSQEWRLNGSLNFPSVVAALTPYVSSFSVSSISSSLAFNPRTSTRITNGVSPNRTFFFPNKLTLYSASLSFSGTPLSLGATKTDQTSKTEEPLEDPFQGIGTPRAPWETPSEDPGKAQKNTTEIDQLAPPALSQQFSLPTSGGPLFTINYQFSPSSASELQFRSSQQNWPETEDIDWSEISSILTNVRGSGSIGFSLSQQNTNLYSISLQLSGNGQWQDYSYINEEAEEYTTGGVTDQTKIDSAHLGNLKATYFSTSYETTTTVRPLYKNAMWGNSNIQYTLKGLLARNAFDGTVDDPSWKIDYGEWTKEKIDAHQLAMNLAASIMEKSQTLTISTDLPPRDAVLSGNATFNAWITSTNINTKITNPWESENRKFEPVNFSETINFGTTYPFQFQQQVTYTPEVEEFTNISSSISWVGLTASFSAIRSRTYTLESAGWIQSTEPERLNPRQFQLTYAKNFKKDSLWDKRLSFSFNISTNLTLDLQQYTKSQFNFTMSFNLGITNFLDLTLSTTTQNAVVFRYFQALPFFELPRELPGEQNFFVDLFNSFRFDDESLRKSSGFKWKSFNLSLVHHLGDWKATLTISIAPSLDQTVRPYQYKFSPEVSFLVQWIPISEIKTDIYHNKDGKTVLR